MPALLMLYSFWFISPLLQSGLPNLGDGEYYLARMANYFLALTQGQFPPRWAPSFNQGIGYPVINFNYPLPNLIGAVFIFLGSSVVNAFKLVFISAHIFALIGMFNLALKLYSSPFGAVLSALVYVTSPHYLVDFYQRGSIGEILIYTLLPWTILVLVKFLNSPTRSNYTFSVIALFLLLIAHNIFSLLSLPLVLVLSINFTKVSYRKLIHPTLLALTLSSFFWIPAVSELKYTQTLNSQLNVIDSTSLISLDHLVSLSKSNLSLFGPDINIPLNLGPTQFIVLLFSLYLWLKNKHSMGHSLLLTGFILTTVAITKQSAILWELFPVAGIIQFPWRLLLLVSLFSAMLVPTIIKISPLVSIAIIISILVTLARLTPPTQFTPYEDPYLYNYPLNSTAANEFDPLWYDHESVGDFLQSYDWKPVFSPQKSTQINIIHQTGTSKNYQVISDLPTQIIESTLYYPGWETTVNNQKIDTFSSRSRFHGLINYSLPPGEFIITTRFTQNTPARIISNSLSLAGLLIFGFSIKRFPKLV